MNPRVGSEKLGKHAVFGSMSGCDSEVSGFCPTSVIGFAEGCGGLLIGVMGACK